ncbi:MAG TPA: class I SAM-dependent methyltransferase [Patescibacteria group bacterium]|nr:class I SAM-dependent methyltransferase [Patescibacteria group bacterium]
MSMHHADEVLRDIEAAAKNEYLPIIGPAEGAALERLVRERRPRRAVEIGVMVGYATVRIARNLEDGAKVIGIEISEELARRAEANLALAGLARRADIRRGDARELVAHLDGPIDFVFIDAERGSYLGYLRKLEPKLAPGATVVASGAGAAAGRLQAYFDHVRLSGKYASEHVVLDDDGIEVSTYRG